MNPSFEIFGQLVFIFGITIVACFFLFLWMLKKLSVRLSFDLHFITNSMLWYFLSVFFFSRLFYIISLWKDRGNINSLFDFFITSDYNFSLYGAIFGFFLILYLNTRLFKRSIHKYIDGVVLSFLFVSIFGFIGAFFGGQVYGKITEYGIEIPYTNSSSFVPLTGELFPLPLIYSGVFFILFSVLYILSMYIKTRGIIGYIGLGIFSATILGLDFFSGKPDIFKALYNINLSQIMAIFFIAFSFYGLFRVVTKSKKSETTILGKPNE